MKKNKTDRIIKERILITFTLLVIVISMSVGYAYYSEELKIAANIELTGTSLMIKNSKVSAYENAYNEEIRYGVLDDEYNLNIKQIFKFTESSSMNSVSNYISYTYTLVNLTSESLVFTGIDSLNETEINLNEPIIEGIKEGEVLKSSEERVITITYYSKEKLEQEYYIESSLNLLFTNDLNYETTSVVTMVAPNEITVTELIPINLELLSTYSYSLYYKVICDNDLFELVDANGNIINESFIIGSGITEDLTIYLRLKDDTSLNAPLTVKLYIENLDEERIAEASILIIL